MQEVLERPSRECRPPPARGPSRVRDRSRRGGRGSGEAASVLLVEHSQELRAQLMRVLEGAGILVTALGDGDTAIAWLDDSPEPDLVILDWQLPQPVGGALIDWIREDERWDDVPVIALLHDLDGVAVVDALACGVDACVISPFDPAWLVEVVARYL
ncbi:MAG: response regulator [Burkholderiaceae bacterium]